MDTQLFAFVAFLIWQGNESWCNGYSVLCVGVSSADFSVSRVHGSSMVLQMEPKRSRIWGQGENGATVNIVLGTQRFNTTVDASGAWSMVFPPQPAGGPHLLLIEHASLQGLILTTELSDVWFGDVWICAGNTQMAYPLSMVLNATYELEKALNYTQIRMFQVGLDVSDVELSDLRVVDMQWTPITSANVGDFSAACLMFAERLADVLVSRPLGLVQVTQEAPIEAFVSTGVTTTCNTPPTPELGPEANTALWNAMVHPLTGTAVRGVVWTDGNSNVFYNYALYQCHLTTLIRDWQNSFLDGDVVPDSGVAFPFAIIQMGPAYTSEDNELHALVRWFQTASYGVVPNSVTPDAILAPALDLADSKHGDTELYNFADKATAATRLANAAISLLYNGSYPFNGPVVMSLDQSVPGQVTLTYDRDIRWTGGSGFSGFSFELSGSDWRDTEVLTWDRRSVTVAVDPAALQLTFGWKALLCEYLQCPIYSDDEHALPAVMGAWLLQ